jgi:hypothetical protein
MNVSSMTRLYDTLVSDLTLGKALPKEWSSSDMRNLKYMSDYYTMLLNGGSYGKIFSTLVMMTLKEKMESVMQGGLSSEYRKWSMFISRESTLAPLLTVLNLSSAECIK